jgi:hypothetical protein
MDECNTRWMIVVYNHSTQWEYIGSGNVDISPSGTFQGNEHRRAFTYHSTIRHAIPPGRTHTNSTQLTMLKSLSVLIAIQFKLTMISIFFVLSN